jgi:hypothetical protein
MRFAFCIPSDSRKALTLTWRCRRAAQIDNTSLREAGQWPMAVDSNCLTIITGEVVAFEIGQGCHDSMPPHRDDATVACAEPTEIFEVGFHRGRFSGHRRLIFIVGATRKTVRTAKRAEILELLMPGLEKRMQGPVCPSGVAARIASTVGAKRLTEHRTRKGAQVNRLITRRMALLRLHLNRRGYES